LIPFCSILFRSTLFRSITFHQSKRSPKYELSHSIVDPILGSSLTPPSRTTTLIPFVEKIVGVSGKTIGQCSMTTIERRHIYAKNFKALGKRITSFIYITCSSFVVNIRLNYSYLNCLKINYSQLKSNNCSMFFHFTSPCHLFGPFKYNNLNIFD
jgi:hypothetical protein